MIISASRRTDIPAFFSDWFLNRLRAGFVYVRNPMNIHQVSKISLHHEVVDCFVFWSKNPAPMIPKMQELIAYNIPFYFQYTINPYHCPIEPHVPEKEYAFRTFISLAQMIGKERMIWRYDPIIFTDSIDAHYHMQSFELIASKISKYTNQCVISFLDFYQKTQRNMRPIPFYDPLPEDKVSLAKELSLIAGQYGLKLVTCAERIELSGLGIRPGKCIDPELISYLGNGRVIASKDKNQREECGCVASIDIGMYDTCVHGCLYCYANCNHDEIAHNFKKHNPHAPVLFGEITSKDKVTERKIRSVMDAQGTLL